MTAGSDYEEVDCPLCLEELDLTDRAIQYCACGYRMCLWCYHHILEEASKASLPAKCPNCRSEYDQDKITMQHIDAEKLEEEKRKNKEKDKKPGAAESAPKSRANLTNVRVVQPNLVYAVGLPLEICNEDLLREQEYFGQFGKVFKISVNRSNQFASALAKHGPTGSAYVTFRRPEDALRCIKLLDGSCWKGKPIKACFGTTKYCNAFLKGVVCNNPDCLYLHDLADEADCLTKEEVAAGLLPARFMAMGASNTFKPRLTINPIQNATTAAAQAAAAAAVAAGQPMSVVQAAAAAAGGVNRLPSAGGPAQPRTAAVVIAPRIVLNDGGGSSSGMWGSPSMASLGSAGTSAPKLGATWAAISAGGAGAAAAAGPPPPPPTDDQEWPELGGPAINAAGGGMGAGSQSSGAASPEREEVSEGLSRGGSLAMPGSQSGATMAEQLARAHSNPPDKGGAGYGGAGAAAKPAKKLLPLSSPAKLKPLSKQPSAQQLQRGGTPAAESSGTAAPAAERNKTSARVGSPPSSPSLAPVLPSQDAAQQMQQPEQQAAPAAAAIAVEVATLSANGAVASQQAAAGQGLGAPAGSTSNKENLAAQHAVESELPVVQAAVEPVASKPHLVPPPGFAAPAAGAAAAATMANDTAQPRPKKITPPPGFGGPAASISTGATPSASAHTSIDSLSQLGDGNSARGGAPTASGAPAASQQEAYSAFSAFSTAAAASSGSLFGSSNSLVERLPSAGELQVAAASCEALPPVAPLAATAAIPISTGRSKSRFKFAQTDGAGQGAGAAGDHGAAAPAQPAPATAAGPAALTHQPPSSASSAFNPLSMLQQQPQQQPAQVSPSAQDAGAFFKSLFPGVNINVSSAAAAPRQPPPGFGPPAAAPGAYGSTDNGSGLFGGPSSTSPAPYLGTSPAAAMYNPLAGMFASPQQPPQYHQQQQQHLLHQQQHAQQQQGLGVGVGLSPGLALLRQLQGANAGQHHHQQQQVQQQAQQYHHQQQQAAQAQYAQSQYGQLQLGAGFVDPAIMAARPAAPPGFGGGNLGMSSGLLGYDRPRPSMPPPGFGLQF